MSGLDWLLRLGELVRPIPHTPVEHGTREAYRAGCRCKRCCEGHSFRKKCREAFR